MKQIKTEIEGIFRDVSTGALLNKDNTSLEAYKKLKRKNQEIEEMKHKINSLESVVYDIKTLLLKLVEKNDDSNSSSNH